MLNGGAQNVTVGRSWRRLGKRELSPESCYRKSKHNDRSKHCATPQLNLSIMLRLGSARQALRARRLRQEKVREAHVLPD
jgi:hypothetical protein